MPLYEYQCEACEQKFEVIRRFSDPELETCARCGKGPVRRLISSPAIQFKGSGWYITDYSQKGKSGPDAPSTASGNESKPAPTTETGSAKAETPTPATKPTPSDT